MVLYLCQSRFLPPRLLTLHGLVLPWGSGKRGQHKVTRHCAFGAVRVLQIVSFAVNSNDPPKSPSGTSVKSYDVLQSTKVILRTYRRLSQCQCISEGLLEGLQWGSSPQGRPQGC